MLNAPGRSGEPATRVLVPKLVGSAAKPGPDAARAIDAPVADAAVDDAAIDAPIAIDAGGIDAPADARTKVPHGRP